VGRERGDEWATVATSRREVRIPWTSRHALLERLGGVSREKEIFEAFDRAGTSQSVVLEPVDKHMLLAVIQFWIAEVSLAGLPEGIDDLQSALIDDARDRGMTSLR
jgi:hypothetical protein